MIIQMVLNRYELVGTLPIRCWSVTEIQDKTHALIIRALEFSQKRNARVGEIGL